MTDEERTKVVREVEQALDDWAAALRGLNANTVYASLWDGEGELVWAENGKFFSGYPELKQHLVDWYRDAGSMQFEFRERTIIPWSAGIALAKGFMTYRTVTNGGEVYEGTNAFTFVLAKKTGGWKAIMGHESELGPEDQA